MELLQTLNRTFDGRGVVIKDSGSNKAATDMTKIDVGILGDGDVDFAKGNQGHTKEVTFETSSQIIVKLNSGEIDFSTPPLLVESIYNKEAVDSESHDLQYLEDVDALINQSKTPEKIDDLPASKRKKCEVTDDFTGPSFALLSPTSSDISDCMYNTGNDEFCTAEDVKKS